MTRLARLRTWLNRATFGLLLAQIGLMIGLTVFESARNKRRKLRSFPPSLRRRCRRARTR